MTFRRPALSRCVTFAEVAAETRLPEEEVELLVMKALAQNLVRGHIDQVDRTVNLVWVQPRVLDKNQVRSAPASLLASRFSALWLRSKCRSALDTGRFPHRELLH